MSRTKDRNIAGCSFSEEVVSYLYNEIGASKRTEFESHLMSCDTCTAELADVSFARLDVYEWHRDEFAEMPTPRIIIPYGEAAKASWVDAIRSFFGSPARLATAGAAFAVVTLALGIVFLRAPTEESLMAVNKQVPEVVQDTVSRPDSAVVDDSSKNDDIGQAEDEKVFAKDPDVKPVKASVIRNSQNRGPKTVRSTPRNTPQPATARRNAPRLNDFEDEDDNTLRLGDLLAEIGTRDE